MIRRTVFLASATLFVLSVAVAPWWFPDPVDLWYAPGDVPDAPVAPLRAALTLATVFSLLAVAAWTVGAALSSLAETFGGGRVAVGAVVRHTLFLRRTPTTRPGEEP